MKVTVVEYNPTWPFQFSTIHNDLTTALQGTTYKGIEHIGSTSIPGLSAKSIIDITVVIYSKTELPAVILALSYAGYTYLGDKGIPDRYAFKQVSESGPKRNLYVCVDGCLGLRNQIGLRDMLRENDALRDEYGAVKVELATREFESGDEYVEAKSEII